jgi:hypothetical protein
MVYLRKRLSDGSARVCGEPADDDANLSADGVGSGVIDVDVRK